MIPHGRFPGQEHQAGNFKIPCVIWYDRYGDVAKAGAEAEERPNISTAEERRPGLDEGRTVRCVSISLINQSHHNVCASFKLCHHLKYMKLEMNVKLPRLPRSKSVLEIFSDFLKYLFRCTRSFIVETRVGGVVVWKSVENDTQFILSHPNGWEGASPAKQDARGRHLQWSSPQH